MHISSSYAKILGEKLFCTWEIPRSGSKAKNGEKERKKERKRERLKNGDNNGQATHGARKHAWRTQAAWANKQTGGSQIVVAVLRHFEGIDVGHGTLLPFLRLVHSAVSKLDTLP